MGWSWSIKAASVFMAVSTLAPSLVFAQDESGRHKRHAEEDDESFGPDDLGSRDEDAGVGVHREQAGVDKPYFNEVGGTTTLSFLNAKVGSGSANSETNVDLGGNVLAIFGRVELGMDLRYQSTQSTMQVVTGTGAAAVATSEKQISTTYSVGPMIKLNIGNIDHRMLVPFGLFGVSYAGTQSKLGSASSVNSGGAALRLGGGLNMFLSDHVAFQPILEYDYSSLKPTSGGDSTTISGVRVLFGLATFL